MSKDTFAKPADKNKPYVITGDGNVVVNVSKLLREKRAKDLRGDATRIVEWSKKK